MLGLWVEDNQSMYQPKYDNKKNKKTMNASTVWPNYVQIGKKVFGQSCHYPHNFSCIKKTKKTSFTEEKAVSYKTTHFLYIQMANLSNQLST